MAFQLRKSGWKSARFLCDEEEVKRNETSESSLYLSDTPLYVKGWSWTWLRSEAGQGRGWEVQVSLEIIWNEKEYRYDTVKRVAIGVNPADGYTLFFWKDVTEVEQEANQFLGEEPIGKLMQKYAIPCIISLLVDALYIIVDQIFIANASYLGSYGNAANTVVFPLTVIALAIAVMIGDGCCAFVSLNLGRKYKSRRKS